MTPALVTELKRLEREATCAPWKGDEFEAVAPKAETDISGNVKLVWADDYHMNEWDAAFVLALRNAAPALLEAVETMHAALELLAFDLERNASGKQQYGGFHTVQEEFQAIWHNADKALARVAGLLGEGREK